MNLGPYEVNSIYAVECVEAMAQMPEECIDLVVTSPPYENQRVYLGFKFSYREVIEGLYRVMKSGGVVVWVVGDVTDKGTESLESFRQALYAKEVGFRQHDTMIYAKHNYVPLTHNRYEQAFEYMFVWSKGRPKTFNPIMIPCTEKGYRWTTLHLQSSASAGESRGAMRKGKRRRPDEHIKIKGKKIKGNVWTYSVGGGHTSSDKFYREHPASMPEQLALDHILSWSNENDLVFDPMCGSGTTPKMALQAHRQYLGFDISPEYAELSRRRLREVQTRLF